MEVADPNPTAEAIGALLNDDNPWDMNHHQLDAQVHFKESNIGHQGMQFIISGRTGFSNQVSDRIVDEVEDGRVLDGCHRRVAT